MRLNRAEVSEAIAAYVRRKLQLVGDYEFTTDYRVDLQFEPNTTVPRTEFAGVEVLALPIAPLAAAAPASAEATAAEPG